MICAEYFSKRFKSLESIVAVGISASLGAEIMFTYAQYAIICKWCPICLMVATTVAILFILISIRSINKLVASINNHQNEEIMKNLFKGASCLFIIFLGFFFSFLGFGKFNQLQAAENNIKESIAFGNLKSPIEIYIFTDWECPSCRKIEPMLDTSGPEIMKKARVIFVDLPVHPESMNFTPFNLSFMIKDKKDYLKIRDILTEISLKTDAPTDEQVEAAVKKINVKYEQLNYADVSVGIKYFKHLAKQFNVDRTPTVVIVNKDKKKGKKLIGATEISAVNILNAIEALSKE